ncbi:MAG: zinc-ribbon domain-containing protein [Chloroflexi bacterium]|nr:zinc-ribbon domain-containing protein [Chloroflexota bacterium]
MGAAIILVLMAYLAQPFRPSRAEVDWDQTIETWVAQTRAGGWRDGEVKRQRSKETDEHVNFCSQCGRSIGPSDHFCPGCGTNLQGGAE